ncbi:peptidoglycan DD-metalloendopeptidase family protein [Kocuria marina]|nr:peptidoglycan DD-metalloendopeptidase family protein [Kocuria indica]
MSMRPWPETYPVSQSYYGTFSNQFQGGALHGAADGACPTGTPILAPDDGVIVFADWAYNLPGGPNDYGSRWWLLKPAKGDTRGGGGIITVLRNKLGSIWYVAHLSDNNMVRVGQTVQAGDVIGLSGATGIATGAHVHVGLIPAGANIGNGAYGAIDPMPFFTERYAPNKWVSWRGGPTSGTGSAVKPATGVTNKAYTLDTSRRTGFHMARAAYGHGSRITGVTIHHWGVDGQHFDDVVRFLCDTTSASRRANPTSAHYVVQDGRVAQLADDTVATYHSGSAQGNGTTIGIECRPEMTQGDLDTLAQLIADLERKHGPLLLYVHQDWFATACPGRYKAKIPWLVDRVNAIKAGGGAAASVAVATNQKKKQSKDSIGLGANREMEEIMTWYKGGRRDFEGWMQRKVRDGLRDMSGQIQQWIWGYKNKGVNGDADAYGMLTELTRTVRELKTKIDKLEGGK